MGDKGAMAARELAGELAAVAWRGPAEPVTGVVAPPDAIETGLLPDLPEVEEMSGQWPGASGWTMRRAGVNLTVLVVPATLR